MKNNKRKASPSHTWLEKSRMKQASNPVPHATISEISKVMDISNTIISNSPKTNLQVYSPEMKHNKRKGSPSYTRLEKSPMKQTSNPVPHAIILEISKVMDVSNTIISDSPKANLQVYSPEMKNNKRKGSASCSRPKKSPIKQISNQVPHATNSEVMDVSNKIFPDSPKANLQANSLESPIVPSTPEDLMPPSNSISTTTLEPTFMFRVNICSYCADGGHPGFIVHCIGCENMVHGECKNGKGSETNIWWICDRCGEDAEKIAAFKD